MRHAELVRAIESVPAPPRPRADLEQVVTPAAAAATLLEAAVGNDDLVGRSVLDLGCGTGRLAIAAALLGAERVTGVDVDPSALEAARRAAEAHGVSVSFEQGRPRSMERRADTVVMNPPFGAQRRGADREFWDAALRLARRAVYAFSLGASRTFIVERVVARGGHVVASRPVDWELPRTFAHHSRRKVRLDVDLWTIRTGNE